MLGSGIGYCSSQRYGGGDGVVVGGIGCCKDSKV